jgi:predicted Zn-dependent protease
VSDLLALAERALAAGPGTDGLQASVTRERSLTLRFAQSQPTQATSIEDVGVEITALRAGHTGAAATNRTDDDALAACAAAAVSAAEAAARSHGDGDYPGFPEPRPARGHAGFDAATAVLDPTVGGDALAAAFAGCASHGVEAYGVWTAGSVETALASTRGLATTDKVTDAFMKVTAIGADGRSGWAAATGVASGAMDAAGLADEAARKATGAFAGGAGRPPVELPPGDYPVVLEPDAVGTLLEWMGWITFNGLAYAEERSALNGRLGQRVVSPCINLSDSPRFPGTLPRAFDAEGVP